MGIRFRCHHCEHELHVKDFQAGKRGRCPQCEGRFRIPLQDSEYSLQVDAVESELATANSPDTGRARQDSSSVAAESGPRKEAPAKSASHAKGKGKPNKSSQKPSENENASVAASSAESSSESAVEESLQRSAMPETGEDGENKTAQTSIVGPSAMNPDTPAADPNTLDNAMEKPAASVEPAAGELLVEPGVDVYWYVRPPSGGQYGPATTSVLQQWIAERRVTPDTLVWRDGWSDWIPAAGVLSALSLPQQISSLTDADSKRTPISEPSASSGLAAMETTQEELPRAGSPGLAPATASSLRPSLSERNRLDRRQRRKRNYMITLTLLSVIAVILIVALVIALLVPR
ncbi:MAG: DUF4339 domain-containing protein [bacterium]|nr:DUF4339 domain-containing protein [bacterium]